MCIGGDLTPKRHRSVRCTKNGYAGGQYTAHIICVARPERGKEKGRGKRGGGRDREGRMQE